MESAVRSKVPELLPVSIIERQNCRRSLNSLIAQRYLYRRAKGVENWRLASVAIVVSILALDFAIETPLFSQVSTLIVVLSWFAEQALLVRWSSRIKEEAATIQEDFDCFVLRIPWATHRGIERPTEDRIRELSVKAARIAAVTEGLTDWYGRDRIPPEPIQARMYCQRTNCRWDERLRKEWRLSMGTVLISSLVSLLVLAAFTGVSVMEFVLFSAVALRALTWLAVEFREQSAAMKRTRRLHRFLSGEDQDRPISLCDVRLVQDAIFEHRRSCPTVPDWFYRLRKGAHERLEHG